MSGSLERDAAKHAVAHHGILSLLRISSCFPQARSKAADQELQRLLQEGHARIHEMLAQRDALKAEGHLDLALESYQIARCLGEGFTRRHQSNAVAARTDGAVLDVGDSEGAFEHEGGAAQLPREGLNDNRVPGGGGTAGRRIAAQKAPASPEKPIVATQVRPAVSPMLRLPETARSCDRLAKRPKALGPPGPPQRTYAKPFTGHRHRVRRAEPAPHPWCGSRPVANSAAKTGYGGQLSSFVGTST